MSSDWRSITFKLWEPPSGSACHHTGVLVGFANHHQPTSIIPVYGVNCMGCWWLVGSLIGVLFRIINEVCDIFCPIPIPFLPYFKAQVTISPSMIRHQCAPIKKVL